MDNPTISIFENKIFFEIIREIKLFSKFKIKYYKNLNICVKNAEKENELVVFFDNFSNQITTDNFSSILITKKTKKKINFQIISMKN